MGPKVGCHVVRAFSDLCLEWHGLPTKTPTRFARGSALLVPGVGKIGARRRTSFFGTHNTFSGVARCLGERSNREHERAREGVARPDSLQVRDS